MPETIKLDPDELTLGDLDDFEETVGESFFDCIKPGVMPSTKALLALVWITERKSDPTYTLAQAREVKVGDLDIDTDPTEAAG